jgi:hypothetical protein
MVCTACGIVGADAPRNWRKMQASLGGEPPNPSPSDFLLPLSAWFAVGLFVGGIRAFTN